MELVQISHRFRTNQELTRRQEIPYAYFPEPINVNGLPYLSEGFNIRLNNGDWAALYPRHHLMWVSPHLERTREFITHQSLGYDALLSEPMKESFATYYERPIDFNPNTNPVPQGEVMDSTICFLPTNDCGLGCKYCFSGAQPKQFGAMPWEIAKAALDLGTRNAVLNRMRTGSGRLVIRFFGGGEPTEYWDSYSAIVEYARASAKKSNVDVLVATITNGQVDEEHYEWFRDNLDEITVSMDGPPDIQNAQRPTFSGENSFDKSWKFLSTMDALNVNIKGIRVTVTAETVNRMEEIALYFWQNLSKAYNMQFEAVYFSEVGRQNTEMPKALDFVAGIRRVEEMARERHSQGRRHGTVATATRPLAIRVGSYCDSLEGKGLFVTPDGYLSLCSEVSVDADPRKDDYFVGKYDHATKRFRVSEQGASKIRKGLPWWCRGCFAQFSCRGGCEPRSQNPDKYIRRWWCQMVRSNVRHTWSDVRAGLLEPRARIGDPNGEELIWLPKWESSASMDD
jgi:radical SAM protein with 4Fe4S-binding SPASM domain